MGLWVSNGTAAGTHELTGITGADPSGLAPSDLTVYNGEVLFRGLDQSGKAALWITDGTVAGTHELNGIAGASTTGIGLDPSGFTVYGGVALFSGVDSSGNQELWQTNGSAGGTTEIGPVSGTQSMGLFPTDLTVIAMVGPVLTAGANVSYVTGAAPVTLDAGFSVADASAVSLSAATVSISAGFVLGDALSVGSPQAGIVSQYNATTGVLTLSGSASLAAYKIELNSVAYASANATTSSRTITWSVNDGVNASAPATSQVSVSRLPPVVTAGASVTFVAGAAPVALDAGLAVADAAAVSLSAAMVSISAGFVQGDTLSVGSPQTGVASQYNAATGVLTLSGAASLAAYQTELDSITYASANATISSRTILWSVNDGVNASAPVTSHVSVNPDPSAPAPDKNILWQNASGQAAIWEMNGTNVTDASLVGPVPGPGWKVVGTGDFNDDGQSDILWQNTSGQAAIWEMNGTNVTDASLVGPNPGPNWKVVGTGDFNGDGHSDILWQNTSGQVAIWEMDGTNPIAGGSQWVGANPGPDWKAVGTGDFNGDGKSDILFQNTGGQVAIWEMDGTNPIAGGSQWVGANPGPDWKAVGTGDFNGDGKSDILFQNTDGQVAIWEMDGTNPIAGGSQWVGANPGPRLESGRDGRLQWRRQIRYPVSKHGRPGAIWEMNGTNPIAGGSQWVGPNPGPSWLAVKT